ncbi:ion transporter [Acinetobacter pittii]|uniref:ion transporter n=1 Tax=Acinetobacter pittii TaxID=48296 RepID=UPI00062A66F5|nr:ion transporter [Acinetobacter pittii]TDM65200.1 ion transporter [Acinetobacter sp. KU 011TH]TDM65687.1 ion transporter [Acinetobacter sp. KU 013TH]TGU89090.1 ion transporter [Acinetobacter pittii]
MHNSAWKGLRKFFYNNLHNHDYETTVSKCINYFLVILIIGNVAAVLLETVNDLYLNYRIWFDYFENISIAFFSIEYLLRLWSVADRDTTQSSWKTRLNWMKSGEAIIDLMAILPAYLNFFVRIDLRMLRILRLLRLLKLTRYFISLQILLCVIKREKGSFQAVIFILIIMIIMTASGIYMVENKAQPEAFSSIPKSMWWAVVTLTTVGYGDVTPVTNLGKLLGALITILGVGIAALPAGILASGLANELNQRNQRLEQEFRELLQARGIHILHDEIEIERIRQKVGLPKEQAHNLIIQIMREKVLEEEESIREKKCYCPHCGGKLTD